MVAQVQKGLILLDNPDAGDWFWVKYAPDGKALKEGKPAGCIGCHGAKKDNDYPMTGAI